MLLRQPTSNALQKLQRNVMPSKNLNQIRAELKGKKYEPPKDIVTQFVEGFWGKKKVDRAGGGGKTK